MSDNESTTLHDIEVDEYLRSCVDLDDDFIDEEFKRVPADIAYWNHKYADSVREQLFAKHDMARTAARIELEIRAEADDLGLKLREGEITSKVVLHDDYHAAHLKLIDAEAEKIRLRGIVESLAAKKDMLQSLGAKLRIEMEGDPMVRERVARARER